MARFAQPSILVERHAFEVHSRGASTLANQIFSFSRDLLQMYQGAALSSQEHLRIYRA